jgi:type VI secretion system secreted protein VgrG
MSFTQENRILKIDTPLGPDVLLLTDLSGSEGISMLFSYELTCLSFKNDIDFTAIVGKPVTVSINLPNGDDRYINGIVTRFSQGEGGVNEETGQQYAYYTAILAPLLWLLSRTSDCEIFQNLSVPKIVEKVLIDNNINDYRLDLREEYPEWEYCVQYNETDLHFISRLLEEEGICYYFEHDDKKHTLVLADRKDCHALCPDQETARYKTNTDHTLEDEVINDLVWEQEIRHGVHVIKDFNFTMPHTDLATTVPTKDDIGPGERETFFYSSGHDTITEGKRVANIRMEEDAAQVTAIAGSSDCRAFSSGYRFKLQDYYRDDMNDKEYLLTSIGHEASQPYGGDSEFSYSNSFTCIPYEVQYRPPWITRKPLMPGSQTAIVVGPAGEEIFTDEHGRVKVQFHWDRKGKKDENSSCWIRVSNAWAGGGWGGVCVPRIGQEVIVDFLEGDPDRPIITGRVYHGTNRSPYPLPASKMISGMKSNSTPGGGGYNEMSLDDTKGTEKITIHAQHDMNTTVRHDQTNTVNHDFTETIKNNATIKITEGKYSHDVATGTATYHVKSDIKEDYDANQTTTVNQTIAITSKTANIVVSAATTIELKVGLSRIFMDAAGNISIQGMNIAISGAESVSTAGNAIRSTAGNEHEIKGAIVKSEGSATNTVRGGMVMLNP